MKSKKDYRQFHRKVFARTVGMLAASAALVYLIYTALLRGNFASWMVALFTRFSGMDEGAALRLYERTFRSHMDAIIILSVLAVFAVFFRFYLRWLTGYFDRISRGMDVLLRDSQEEISLPAELFAIERKMNAAKHTIGRQKSDMRLAEQKKNDLIMYLAHDLKTPLATAISYLSLLRDEKQLSPELRERYLFIALSKTERLEELVGEFLEIARYSLSGITLQMSEINLTRLLEQLVYEARPMLDARGLSCRLAAEDDILLNCDADKLQRVFDNLLRNAAAYSREKTEIAIEAARGKSGVTLKFSSHGATIPREKLARIFEQFYRLDTGQGAGGSGLGLAIAKQIVTLHGGTIQAESRDGLTVFTVVLPDELPAGGSGRALLCEDEESK